MRRVNHDKTTVVINFDERQRLRLLLLLMAGVLLVIGASFWVYENTKKSEVTIQSQNQPLKVDSKAKVEDSKEKTDKVLPAISTHTPNPADSSGKEVAQAGKIINSSIELTPRSNIEKSQPIESSSDAVNDTSAQKPVDHFIESTPRLLAATEARSGAGRDNPCTIAEGYSAFPRTSLTRSQATSSGKIPIPPPPPSASLLPPPPPPTSTEGDNLFNAPPEPEGGLSADEFPAPPAKPSLADKFKLIAIMGDRAVLAVSDRQLRMDNKWPATITLGRGEQFESMSLVDIKGDSITLDEDGERLVKTMDPLR